MAINLLKINAEAVLCTGDLHGNLNSIGYQIKQFGIQNSLLICCGDIGLGFNKLEYYKQYLNKLKKVLAKYNDYVILLRGNHDDKEYFDKKLINDKRIKAVPDYTVVQVYPMDDKEYVSLPYNVLCVGGATSIDRMHRISVNNKLLMEYSKHHNMETLEKAKKNCLKCYWEDETPVYDEETLNEIKEQGITIDAVTTHTCPSFCQPITKDGIRYWMQFDTNLEKDIDNERNVMDKLYDKLIEDKHPLSVWCYGHYHYHHNDSINGIKYYLLDMERNGKMDIVTIYKILDMKIIHDIYSKWLANDIISTEPSDNNKNKPLFKFVTSEIKRTNFRKITKEDTELVNRYFPNAVLTNNAFKYEVNGSTYIDDGGLLCGCIYRIENDGKLTICGRK